MGENSRRTNIKFCGSGESVRNSKRKKIHSYAEERKERKTWKLFSDDKFLRKNAKKSSRIERGLGAILHASNTIARKHGKKRKKRKKKRKEQKEELA